MNDKQTSPKAKLGKPTVQCPSCKTNVLWDEDNPYRPFCSESCKNKDFIGWANEEHMIGGNSVYDDLLSGDIPPQD